MLLARARVFAHAHAHTHGRTPALRHTRVSTRAHTHAHGHTRVSTHIHTLAHRHTRVATHTRARTHTRVNARAMGGAGAGVVPFLSAADAAAVDAELMGSLGFCLEQLMELAGLSVAGACARLYVCVCAHCKHELARARG